MPSRSASSTSPNVASRAQRRGGDRHHARLESGAGRTRPVDRIDDEQAARGSPRSTSPRSSVYQARPDRSGRFLQHLVGGVLRDLVDAERRVAADGHALARPVRVGAEVRQHG